MNLSLLMRLYLLSGLVLHKVIWEVMKRREPKTFSTKTRLLSGIKLAVLAGIIAQVLGWEILPMSVPFLQPVGLVIYTIGVLTAITARTQLGQNWSDIEKSFVKPDHALVAHGLYKYIRHPIYTGDLLLLFGLELALQSWAVAGVAAVAMYVRQQAVREERNLTETLPGYVEYCRSTGRFVPLTPLLYLGLLAAAPFVLYGGASGAMQAIGRMSKQRYPAPGRMVSVGTHSLQLYCTGSGTPAAVFEPGIGVDWTEWWTVSVPLSDLTQVCLYDRAGYGWSQAGPKPRTASRIATELHTLLLSAGLPGPYILIAHSFGGYVARVYADRFGKSLSGLVLVDPSNEDEPEPPRFFWERVAATLPPLSVRQTERFYLGEGAVPREFTTLPVAFGSRFMIGSSITQIETQRNEEASLPESRAQARAAKIPGSLPLTVITAMHVLSPKHPDPRVPDAPPASHRELHARLARQSARGEQILARDSGHMVPLDQPELIIGAVREMVLQSRRAEGTSP